MKKITDKDGYVIESDAAIAVGRFEENGPLGYKAKSLPFDEAPLRATRAEAVQDEIDFRASRRKTGKEKK